MIIEKLLLLMLSYGNTSLSSSQEITESFNYLCLQCWLFTLIFEIGSNLKKIAALLCLIQANKSKEKISWRGNKTKEKRNRFFYFNTNELQKLKVISTKKLWEIKTWLISTGEGSLIYKAEHYINYAPAT